MWPSSKYVTPQTPTVADLASSSSSRLDSGYNRHHDQHQSSSCSEGVGPAPKCRPSVPGGGYGRTARPSKHKTWTSREEHCFKIVSLMDDFTKHHRAGFLVRQSFYHVSRGLLANQCRCERLDTRKEAVENTSLCLEHPVRDKVQPTGWCSRLSLPYKLVEMFVWVMW